MLARKHTQCPCLGLVERPQEGDEIGAIAGS
jgi:hypothetical protein